jgi:ribosomal protein S18 acetylase RimI-like enzyme
VLAVRRPWRKRGLGYALLKQSFALFQARGFKTAGLGVDASSLTNAVALYERAGMHVKQQRLVFRKMLRGTEEDLHE